MNHIEHIPAADWPIHLRKLEAVMVGQLTGLV